MLKDASVLSSTFTLRSALKRNKTSNNSEKMVYGDNFVDLVEYPHDYSMMVVNFASNLTENVENVFCDFIKQRQRRDIITITMRDIQVFLTSVTEDEKYAKLVAEVEWYGEPVSLELLTMVIRDKIDAAVQENQRILERKEEFYRFDSVNYWNSYTGESDDLLSIVSDNIEPMIPVKGKKSKDKLSVTENGNGKQKLKPKKTRKSKTNLDVLESIPATNGIQDDGEFKYEIPNIEFYSSIWSHLIQRGQEKFDKMYIENFPPLGPKLYVILLNITDTDLLIHLLNEKFHLNSIIEVLPYKASNIGNQWKLFDFSKRRMDIFKEVSFFQHYIMYSPTPYKCLIDRMNAYNLICNMIYDADDIRRQHDNFIINCNEYNVEADITTTVPASQVDFLYSHEIEFYLIDLYKQIDLSDSDGDEENNEDGESITATPTTIIDRPISFDLFNGRILVLENSFKFFVNNHGLEDIDNLNRKYYQFISNINQWNFAKIHKHERDKYDGKKFKYIKNLTKYAFNEIILGLNLICGEAYHRRYYEIQGTNIAILNYVGLPKRKTSNEEHNLLVLPTNLCIRDFKEFRLKEIAGWIANQESVYNDMVLSYLYDNYIARLPKHIEFRLNGVKENNFLYTPSIKLANYRAQQQEFEKLKHKEYAEVFDYIDRKSSFHAASVTAASASGLFREIKKKSTKKATLSIHPSSNQSSGSVMVALRSALKRRKNESIFDENFIELVEYPHDYSLMVVNFASTLTKNVERIFYEYIQQRLRRDIITITMRDVKFYLTSVSKDDKYTKLLAQADWYGDDVPVELLAMVIEEKIAAAVKGVKRLLEAKKEFAKFYYINYWKEHKSQDTLSILSVDTDAIPNKKGNSARPSTLSTNGDGNSRKPSTSKKKKFKSNLNEKEKKAKGNGTPDADGFVYDIPDIEFFNHIWSSFTQRGDEEFNKKYIENFPVLGPKLYIILLNITDTDLLIHLLNDKIHLNSIIEVLPYNAEDVNNEWNSFDFSKRKMDVFKEVSFFQHYVEYSSRPIICYRDRMQAYNLICSMIYDAEDIRRQHENFLINCNEVDVADEITVEVRPSHVDFLFSHEIEFYFMNLYDQIDFDAYDKNEEANEEEGEITLPVPPATIDPPISFHLFNGRILIVEDSYKFFVNNHAIKDIESLNGEYFKFILATNKSHFDTMGRHSSDKYDLKNFKYIKNLTKYAFNEIIFGLNLKCGKIYKRHCYLIEGTNIAILKYEGMPIGSINSSDERHEKYVIATNLCHRDFNEFRVSEIRQWLNSQEIIYNDLVQSYLLEQYAANQPRHIEFLLKGIKEEDFLYTPSIKLTNYSRQKTEFEEMIQNEYSQFFTYIDRISAISLKRLGGDSVVALSRRSKTKSRKGSLATSKSDTTSINQLPKNRRRISEVQPFDEIEAEEELNPFHFHHDKPPIVIVERVPVKAFNTYNLGDTRFQIDVTERDFYLTGGFLNHHLEQHLYHKNYQTIKLQVGQNQFYVNRIFENDVNAKFAVPSMRIITENGTIIYLTLDEEAIESRLPSMTSVNFADSLGVSGDTDSHLTPPQPVIKYSYTVASFAMMWPNGLKIEVMHSFELDTNYIEQIWVQADGQNNEIKRWYFMSGCCVAFGLNSDVTVYTAFGAIYEFRKFDAEIPHGKETSNEKFDEIFENELNYLNFLANYIILQEFKLILANGCTFYVRNGKIVKALIEKPDKLLVKEHTDFIKGEIIMRREDGFKMLVNSSEQIVIFPDGTIIQTGTLHTDAVEDVELRDIKSAPATPTDQTVAQYLLNQMIWYLISDRFESIKRKAVTFYHENYASAAWNLADNEILFGNYDRSINLVYKIGDSIHGNMKCHHDDGRNLEDVYFEYTNEHMTVDHKNANAKINFFCENATDQLMAVENDKLQNLVIWANGKTEIREAQTACVTKLKIKMAIEPIEKYEDRTFLICTDNDDQCFELFTSVPCDRAHDIVKDDDGNVLVLKNLCSLPHSDYKSSSNLYSRIPDTLATKSDRLCNIRDDMPENHEMQLKRSAFNNLSKKYGFEYYQAFKHDTIDDSNIGKGYYRDYRQLESLCENAINYYVDHEYKKKVDDRDDRLARLSPTKAFTDKLRTIQQQHELANCYRLMLRHSIVPKYFDFYCAGSHIKYLDVTKYVKSVKRITKMQDVKFDHSETTISSDVTL